jgi:hypothetical protein
VAMTIPPSTPRASAGARRGSRASVPTCGVCGKHFPQPPRGTSMKTMSCGLGCTVSIRRAGHGRWITKTLLADGTTGTGA